MRFGLLLLKDGADRMPALMAAFQAAIMAISGYESGPIDAIGAPGGSEPSEYNARMGNPLRVSTGDMPAEYADLVREYFPRLHWENAALVSGYESSGWNTNAERNTLDQAGGICSVPIGRLPDGTAIISEQSVGLFQINVCAHGGDRDYWRNPRNNVRKAGQLFAQSGWYPWVWTARHYGLLPRE